MSYIKSNEAKKYPLLSRHREPPVGGRRRWRTVKYIAELPF